MRIVHYERALLRVAASACLVFLWLCPTADGQVNRDLKILYAGRPGSEREKDFVAIPAAALRHRQDR